MATATILHVGDDPCHRIPVMEQGGLSVVQSECSLGAIQHVLAESPAFSAVTFHNEAYPPAEVVISTARALSAAPLVLFHNPFVHCDPSAFDLVIPVQTSPLVWLKSLHEAILESCRLRQASAQLRQDCADVRAASQRLQIASGRNQANRIDVDLLWKSEREE